MESFHLKDLYELYHPKGDIKFYEFYNNFRDEFFESLKNDFSKIIIRYDLDENFVFEHKNLLGHLACFVSDDETLQFFKDYFTEKQLKHMAEYTSCTGCNVFHYLFKQIDNVKLLKFILTLSNNFNDMNASDNTPIDNAINEYGCKYVLDSLWGETFMEAIKNLPEENEEFIGKKRKISKLSELIRVNSIPRKLNFD